MRAQGEKVVMTIGGDHWRGAKPSPRQGEPGCSNVRAAIEAAVGVAFGVSQDDLKIATRGPACAAFARQVAMYLAHVVCSLSLTEVGRIFDRDRTTVAYACGVIEDQRDDPRFDCKLVALEHAVTALIEALNSQERCA